MTSVLHAEHFQKLLCKRPGRRCGLGLFQNAPCLPEVMQFCHFDRSGCVTGAQGAAYAGTSCSRKGHASLHFADQLCLVAKCQRSKTLTWCIDKDTSGNIARGQRAHKCVGVAHHLVRKGWCKACILGLAKGNGCIRCCIGPTQIQIRYPQYILLTTAEGRTCAKVPAWIVTREVAVSRLGRFVRCVVYTMAMIQLYCRAGENFA